MALLAATPAHAARDSVLAQAAAALARQHPGRSGVLLLDTGIEALRQRDALIESAAHTIDAQYYIWNSDASGRYLAARLLAAAERGVRVRAILDDITWAAGVASPAAYTERESPLQSSRPRRLMRTWLHPGFPGQCAGQQVVPRQRGDVVAGALGDEYSDLGPQMNCRDRGLLTVGGATSGGFEAFGPPLAQTVASFTGAKQFSARDARATLSEMLRWQNTIRTGECSHGELPGALGPAACLRHPPTERRRDSTRAAGSSRAPAVVAAAAANPVIRYLSRDESMAEAPGCTTRRDLRARPSLAQRW